MSEWISVNDRLPESGKAVQVFVSGHGIYPYNYICTGFYAEKHGINIDGYIEFCESEYDETTDGYYLVEGWYEAVHNWDDFDSVYINDTVTHWMPLPEPPKEDTP